jgi:uncharacterized protein with FMN-binding domain
VSVEAGHLRLNPGARGWTVDYARPRWSALLVGRPLDEAELCVGRLHGMCGMAHRIALARAAEGAAPVVRERAAARDLLLGVERIEAMARRVALELTTALGLAPAPAIAVPALEAARRARAALGLEAARGPLAPATTLASVVADLLDAFARAVACCPALPRARLAAVGPTLAPLVARAWTGPARLLSELAPALTALVRAVKAAPAAEPLVDGGGEASARTHRGVLTYDVGVAAGRIERVTWTTPTDCRFATDGPARRALAALDRRAVARADLALVMCALDPCIPWSIEASVDA